MEFRYENAVARIADARGLPGVESRSVKLLLCACTHLGGEDTWSEYLQLLHDTIDPRVLTPDGRLVVFQTDAYIDGQVMARGPRVYSAFASWGWELIDSKIWKRLRGNFRQPPFSHVYVFRPRRSAAKRPPNTDRAYFQGVWDYPQTARGKLNSWPDDLCRMIVEAFTDEDDLIVDAFAGSCRILAVANQLGRRAVGFEIDESLAPLIEENIKARPFRRDLTGQLI